MSYDSYHKQYMDANAENIKKGKDNINAIAENKKKSTTEQYTALIDLNNQEYDEDLRANEVQKYINMREVAENNANLGLTDSGLNRTQSTAVQLSASNNAAKIERDRTNMVTSLTAEMNKYLTEYENERISSEQSLMQTYDSAAAEWAGKAHQADVDAATEKYKIAANVSSERIKEIEKEIDKIKIAAVKGRKNSAGAAIEGYDIKTVANDAINDYLNQLVYVGEITEERAKLLYKNLAFSNDLYNTSEDFWSNGRKMSDYLQGYYQNGQVNTKKR